MAFCIVSTIVVLPIALALEVRESVREWRRR